MTFLPEPDPAVIAFLAYRRYVYLVLLAMLAALRVWAGGGIARWPALAALLLALGGIATTFAPSLGLNQGPLYVEAAQAMATGGGMAAALVPTVLLALSGILPGARWKALDWAHGAILAVLLGLWWWTG